MALLVGDVVTNFVAKIDDVTKAVSGIQDRLDKLAKQTFSVKLGADESKLVRAIQRIDVNIARVRSSVEQVGRAFGALTTGAATSVVKAAAATQGTIRKTAANSRKSLQEVAAEGRKAGGLLSISFRNAVQSFLDWSGAITVAALTAIPGFIAITSKSSDAVAGQADNLDRLAGATANASVGVDTLTGNFEDGFAILSDTSDITTFLNQNFAGLTTTLAAAGTTVQQFFGGIQEFGFFVGTQLAGVVETLGNGIQFVGQALQSAVTPLLNLLGLGREAVNTGQQAVTLLDILTPRIAVIGTFALALTGVNFVLRSIVGRIRTLAATRPDTVLGRVAALVNTLFLAINNLVSPITVLANKLASILGIVTVLGSATLAVVFNISTLFTGLQATFGLFAIASPLITNLFLRLRVGLVRIAAALGSGRARFILFFGEIREALGGIAKEFNELRRSFGRRFNFIQFFVRSFETIRQSVQAIAQIGQQLLLVLIQGGQLTAGLVEQSTRIVSNVAQLPALQEASNRRSKESTSNLQDQAVLTERLAAVLSSIANNFWPSILNVSRNLVISPFVLLRQVAVSTFNQVRTVALGFLVKPIEGVGATFLKLFSKVVPDSFRQLGSFFRRVGSTLLAPFTTETTKLAERFRSIWRPSEESLERQFVDASKRIKTLENDRARADERRVAGIEKVQAVQAKFVAEAESIEKRRNELVKESSKSEKELTAEIEKQASLQKNKDAALKTDREALRAAKEKIGPLQQELKILDRLARSRSENVREQLQKRLLSLQNAQTEAVKKLQRANEKLTAAEKARESALRQVDVTTKKATAAQADFTKREEEELAAKAKVKAAELELQQLRDRQAAGDKEAGKLIGSRISKLNFAKVALRDLTTAREKAAQAQKIANAEANGAAKALEKQQAAVIKLRAEFDQLGGATKNLRQIAAANVEQARTQLQTLEAQRTATQTRINLADLERQAAIDKEARARQELATLTAATQKELALLNQRKVALTADAAEQQTIIERNIASFNKEAEAVERAIDKEVRALERRKTILARQAAETQRGATAAQFRRGVDAEFATATRQAFGGARQIAEQGTQEIGNVVTSGVQRASQSVQTLIQQGTEQAGQIALSGTVKTAQEIDAEIRKFATNIRDALGVSRGGGSETLVAAIANGDLSAFVQNRVRPNLTNLGRTSRAFFAQSKTDFEAFVRKVNALAREANISAQVRAAFEPFLLELARIRDEAERTSTQIRQTLEKTFQLRFNVGQAAGAATPTKAFQGVFTKLAVALKTQGEEVARRGAREFLVQFAKNLSAADQKAVEDAIILALRPLADALPASPTKNRKSPAAIAEDRARNVGKEIGKNIVLGQGDLVTSVNQLFTGVANEAQPLVQNQMERVTGSARESLLRFAETVRGTFSARLFALAAQGLGQFSEDLGPRFTARLRTVDNAITGTANRFANFIERLDARTVLDGILTGFQKLGAGILRVKDVVDEFGQRITGDKIKFSEFLQALVAGQATLSLFFQAMAAGIPFMAQFDVLTSSIFFGVLALNGALEGLARTGAGTFNTVSGLVKAVTGIIGGVATFRIDRIAEGIRGAGQALKGLFQIITGPIRAVTGVVQTFVNVLRGLFQIASVLAGTLQTVGRGLATGLAQFARAFNRVVPRQLIRSGGEIVRLVGQGIAGAGRFLFGAMGKVLKRGVKDQVPASPPLSGPLAGNFLTDAGGKMIEMLSLGILKQGGILNRAVGTVLSGAFLPVFGPASLIASGIKGIVGLIKSVGDQLTNLANNPAISALKQTGDQIIEIGLTAERFAPSDEAADDFIQKFDAFARAVKPLGIEASRVETIFVTLERALSDAVAEPLGEAAAKFQRLGVDLTAFAGGEEDIIDVTLRLADQIKSGTLEAEELQDAFELTAATFGPLKNLLLRGGEEIRTGMMRAAEVGMLIDGEAVDQAIEFNKQIDEFEFAIEGIKRTIFTEIVPVFTGFLADVQAWWARNKESVISGVRLLSEVFRILFDIVIKKIAEWSQNSNKFFEDIGSILNFLFQATFKFIETVFTKVGGLGRVFGNVVEKILIPLFGATADLVINVIFPRIGAAFIRLVNEGAKALGGDFIKVVNTIIKTIVDGISLLQKAAGQKSIREEQQETLAEAQAAAERVRRIINGNNQSLQEAKRFRDQLARSVQEGQLNVENAFSEQSRARHEEVLAENRELLARAEADVARIEAKNQDAQRLLKSAEDDIRASRVALGQDIDTTELTGLTKAADDLDKASERAAKRFARDIPLLFKEVATETGKQAAELGKVALEVVDDFAPEFRKLIGGLAEDLGIEEEVGAIGDKLLEFQKLLSEAGQQAETDAQREAVANVQRQLNSIQRSFRVNEALLISFSKKVEELRRRAGEILGLDILDLEDFKRGRQIALAELDQEISKLKKTQEDLIRQRESLLGFRGEETTQQFIERFQDIELLGRAIETNERALAGLNSQLELTRKLADQSDTVRTWEKLAASFTNADTELGKLIAKEIEFNKSQVELAQNLAVVEAKLGEELASGVEGPVLKSLELFKNKALEVGGEVGAKIKELFDQFLAFKAAGAIEDAAATAAQIFQAIKEASDKAQEEEADTRFDELASTLADKVRESLTDAIKEFNENEGKVQVGRLFNNLFKSISEALVTNLINDMTKQLTESLKDGFKEVFSFAGEQAGALATAATAAVAIVLQFLTKQSQDEIAVAKEGLQSVVEETERVRGIISGESTIKLKEVADNLREALMPTNDILRRIEFNTRVGLAASPATPLAQAVGGS